MNVGASLALLCVLFCASSITRASTRQLESTEESIKTLSMGSPMFRIPARATACKIDNDIVLSGRVQTETQAVLKSKWPSHIEKIHVKVGQSVKKGQPIATVATTFLNRHIAHIQQSLDLARRQIKLSEADLKSIRARQSRVEGLVGKGIMPPKELDAIDEAVLAAENELVAKERARLAIEKSLADLENQRRNSNFFAPIDGIVTQLIADPGSIVGTVLTSMNATVARIDQPGRYIISAQALDIQAGHLIANQQALVRIPDGSAYKGSIRSVSPVPHTIKKEEDNPFSFGSEEKSEPRTYTVEIPFERPGAMLPLGLLASVQISINNETSTNCVPWNAVRIANGKAYLTTFVDREGWTVRPVTLGRRGRHFVEVLSPLPEGVSLASSLW